MGVIIIALLFFQQKFPDVGGSNINIEQYFNSTQNVTVIIKNLSFLIRTSNWKILNTSVSIEDSYLQYLVLHMISNEEKNDPSVIRNCTLGSITLEMVQNMTISNCSKISDKDVHDFTVHLIDSVVSMDKLVIEKANYIWPNKTEMPNGSPIWVAMGSHLCISDSKLTDNNVTNSAFLVEGNSFVKMFNVDIKRNNGGGFMILSSRVDIFKSNFEDNFSDGGTAITVQTNAELSIQASNFTRNVASLVGGAIFAAYNVTLKINGSTFIENETKKVTGFTDIEFGVSRSKRVRINPRSPVNDYSQNYNGGAISIQNNCQMTITTSHFVRNYAQNYGGALVATNDTNLAISESLFDSNVADFYSGGAILTEFNVKLSIRKTNFTSNQGYNAGAVRGMHKVDMYVQNSNFFNNSASVDFPDGYGAAIVLLANCSLTFESSSVVNNTCSGTGSGIVIADGPLTVTHSNFSNNNAGHVSGSLLVKNSNRATIHDSNFIGNNVGKSGGAVYLDNSDVQISRSIFKGNTASMGSAIYSENCNLTLSNCQVNNNNASGYGSGIFLRLGQVNLLDTTFKSNLADAGTIYLLRSTYCKMTRVTMEHNKATGDGGGLSITQKSVLELEDTHFFSNTAIQRGAVLYTEDTITMRAVNCTFIGNSVDPRRGMSSGIYAAGKSDVCLDYCTFKNNNGAFDAGAVKIIDGILRLAKCLFSNNTAEQGMDIYVENRGNIMTYDSIFNHENITISSNDPNFSDVAEKENFIVGTLKHSEVIIGETKYASGMWYTNQYCTFSWVLFYKVV